MQAHLRRAAPSAGQLCSRARLCTQRKAILSHSPSTTTQPSGRGRAATIVAMAAAASAAGAAAASAGAERKLDISALSAAPIVVVSIPACPYCKKAKEALTSAGHPYLELDASMEPDLRTKVRTLSGSRTVPQIFVGGKSLGGSDDLTQALASGRFAEALAAAQSAGTPALPAELVQAAKEAAERVQASSQGNSQAAGGMSAEQRQSLAEIATRMAKAPGSEGGIPRKEAQVGPRALKAFTQQQLLDWLASQPPTVTAGHSWSGPDLVTALLSANLITPATPEHPLPPVALGINSGGNNSGVGSQAATASNPAALYALVSEAPQPQRSNNFMLNTHFWWSGPARSATEVATELRGLILSLYDAHLSADGRAVNYKAMAKDPLFKRFVDATAELQRVDITPLNREELMALFINLYNALIIHALVVLGPPTAAQRGSFYSKDSAYCIGGRRYTADDMENGVLRCNRAAASNLWVLVGLHGMAGGQFGGNDPRAAKIACPPDPRIHFALVCGAKSCPPIKLYTPDNLEEGLAAAAEAFCASEVVVDAAQGSVAISKIFKWYAVDFGSNERERLQYISQFLQGKQKSDLEAMLASGKKIKVQYREYDWGLNE